MSDVRIDLSSLSPWGDEQRWEEVVASVTRRAWRARQRALTVGAQLRAWAMPALVTAAATALMAWLGALARGSPSVPSSGVERALVLAGWASGNEAPSTSRILEVLGGAE